MACCNAVTLLLRRVEIAAEMLDMAACRLLCHAGGWRWHAISPREDSQSDFKSPLDKTIFYNEENWAPL